jgi:hypothetical protein
MEPPSGLLSWWPGDGNGDDVHSNLNASVVDGAGFAPGLVGEAFDLESAGVGMGDRVYLPTASLDGVVDMTVELWVNTIDSNEGAILSGANGSPGGGDNELVLFQYKTAVELVVAVKNTSMGRIPAVVSDGQWHHLAFTRVKGMGRVYVDGIMIAEVSGLPLGAMDIGPGGLMLGQEQDCLGGCFQDGAQAFDGLIDELAFYGRALSPDEISGIVDAGAYGKCKPPVPPSLDELMERVVYLESDTDLLNLRVADLEAKLAAQEFLMEDLEEMGNFDLTQDLEAFEQYLYETYHLKYRGDHKVKVKHKKHK